MSGRVAKWLASGDTGSSSKTIALWLQFGERYAYASVPWDPSDLGRCLRMLKACPHLRQHLPRMAELGGLWPKFVERWNDMAASMEREVGIDWSKGRSAPETYQLMKAVEAEARTAQGRPA